MKKKSIRRSGGMRGITSYKAAGIYMEDFLRDAGISFGKGMTAKLRTNDMASTGNDPENEDAYYDRGQLGKTQIRSEKRIGTKKACIRWKKVEGAYSAARKVKNNEI